jgi:hypothetical protein
LAAAALVLKELTVSPAYKVRRARLIPSRPWAAVAVVGVSKEAFPVVLAAVEDLDITRRVLGQRVKETLAALVVPLQIVTPGAVAVAVQGRQDRQVQTHAGETVALV